MIEIFERYRQAQLRDLQRRQHERERFLRAGDKAPPFPSLETETLPDDSGETRERVKHE